MRGARRRATRARTIRGRQTNGVRGGARRKSQARPDARTRARMCETTSLLPHRARRPSRRTSSTRSSTRRSGCPCRAPTARSATARPRRPRCAATLTSRAPSSVGTKGESVVAAPLRPSGGRAGHRSGTRGRGPPKRGRTSTDALVACLLVLHLVCCLCTIIEADYCLCVVVTPGDVDVVIMFDHLLHILLIPT